MGKQFKFVNAADGMLEIYIYNEIGDFFGPGLTARAFARQLRDAGDVAKIRLFLNSPGGDVFEGLTIFNELKGHPAAVEVIVRGLAASAASLIAMAGDRIVMADGTFLMIHNVWTLAMGDAQEMEKIASDLKKMDAELAGIYSRRSGKDEAALREMMNAETWLNADEAIAAGLADGREDAGAPLFGDARFNGRLFGFRNVPPAMKAMFDEAAEEDLARVEAAPAPAEEVCIETEKLTEPPAKPRSNVARQRLADTRLKTNGGGCR